LPFVAFGAAAILPGKHFFRDDVGLFAYASGEEFGGLEDGRADFVEVVGAENVADGGFDEVPERRFGREKVAGSSGGFDGRSLVAGHWSFAVCRLPSFCVELAILVSLRDLISLSLNWRFCGSGQVVFSQPKRSSNASDCARASPEMVSAGMQNSGTLAAAAS
jgi:hypothetical protein